MKPPVPNLRIAVPGQEESIVDSRKKRLNSLDLNESQTQKVKGSPEYDLNEILGKILGRFIDEPSFSSFIHPTTPEISPDYHLKIVNPICLQEVRKVIGYLRVYFS